MSSGKVLLSVLAGAAAGALAGLLFAPARGRKTRKRLLIKGKDYSGKFEKIMDDVFFKNKNTVQYEDEVLSYSQII